MKPIYKTLFKNLSEEDKIKLALPQHHIDAIKNFEGRFPSLHLLDKDARVVLRELYVDLYSNELPDIDVTKLTDDELRHINVTKLTNTSAYRMWKERNVQPVLEERHEELEKTVLAKKSGRGRKQEDYTITLETAIQIAMRASGTKASELRTYFFAVHQLLMQYIKLGWVYGSIRGNDKKGLRASYCAFGKPDQNIEARSIAKAILGSRTDLNYESMAIYDDCYEKAIKLLQRGMSKDKAIEHLSILY
ncbi:TPA: antA/AntB antirepressor family protein [Salmonella enterica subsp. enterica serovar Infantis]|nr:antA/AntB antirepressor family protein [Salmonella enterica subsp. enterica serovar Infantis]